MRCPRFGFTVVEVLVALVVFVVGALALVGSLAMVVRMTGRGRQATLTASVATARLEWLREVAGATSPPCGSLALAPGATVTSGVGEQWEVTVGANVRRLELILERRDPAGRRRDTLHSAVLCRW